MFVPFRNCIIALAMASLGSIAHGGDQITVAGSSTVRPIVKKAAAEFKKTHPDVEFVIGGGGSSHGVKSVATGQVTIGMASRDLKGKETTEWPGLVPVSIGRDGIALIVNSRNPISKITKQQVQDIYTGKITNWKELGGKDAPIVLVSKEHGRSTLELFLKYFDLEAEEVGEGKSAVMRHRVKGATQYAELTARLIGPNREALAEIAMKPNAIAYVSVGTAQEIAAKGGRVTLLQLDGVPASVVNVDNQTYPLRRPLNVVTKGEATGNVKEFIDFLLGNEGQAIVAGLEFIPINDAATIVASGEE